MIAAVLIAVGTLQLLKPLNLGVFRMQLALIAGGMMYIGSGKGPLGWRGTCVIELIDNRLTCTEYIGPFPWRHIVQAEEIKQLVIGGDDWLRGDFPAKVLLGIRVDTTRGSWWMARGYPRAMLADLVTDLAPRCGSRMRIGSPKEATAVKIRSYASDDPLGLTYNVHARPLETEVIIEQSARAVEFYVPPMGFWKAPTGGASIAVGAFVLLLTALLVVVAGKVGIQDGELPLVLFGLAGFTGAAIYHFVRAVHTGCTATSLMATAEGLSICCRGTLSNQVFRLPRERIMSIRLSNAYIRGGGRKDYMQLWIAVENQKPVTLLKARHPDELRWIATTLRERLGVPATDFA
jgi:hypothetical protein